ncbi:MAG: hypothetical protein JXB14_07725 [Candidatus Altiarchaeota archaeon]|nr:hypothetical protein [Candidatus Altiarchaeota archaeon]
MIPVFCGHGVGMSVDACHNLNIGRPDNLSHVVFSPQGVHPRSLGLGPLSPEEKRHVRETSKDVPLTMAVAPPYRDRILEAFKETGEKPPHIITLFKGEKEIRPQYLKALKEVEEYLRERGHA